MPGTDAASVDRHGAGQHPLTTHGPRTHDLPSFPIVWLGLAWLGGIALGQQLTGWWPLALWGLVALAILAARYPARWRVFLGGAFLIVVALAGAWRASNVRVTPADLPSGQITALRGQVLDWPDQGNSGVTATIVLDAVRVDGAWQDGAARVRADLPFAPTVARGDRVELTGYYRSVAAIGLPGLRASLTRQGLHGQFRAFSVRVLAPGQPPDLDVWRIASREALKERVRRVVPAPEAGLVTGVLLGDDTLLTTAEHADFTATNTAHVMVLSGWNIALVAGVCAALGRRIGRARAWWWLALSLGAIWGYTALVGASPTLLRAAIMGTLYLLAALLGRREDALAALAVAVLAMTAVAPGTLADIGFQLSCAATLGLILCSTRFAASAPLRHVPAAIASSLAATIAAELFTLPLIVHHFGRLSTVTLPANLLVEPLVPLVMSGGMLAVLVSLLPAPLASAGGVIAWLPARLLLLIVEGLGAQPWATFAVPQPSWLVVAATYALIGATLTLPAWWPKRRALASAWVAAARPGWALLLCGLLAGLAASAWLLLLAG
ncbi:MAG: ComEC/Rec2 family competence protein [Thermomicrobiales bacterium]